MGCYEQEQALIASGQAQRGWAVQQYFKELDAEISEEASKLKHRPSYKALFAPENDDIYRELCRYIDMPTPRYFDKIDNPMVIDGHTSADVYLAMISHNDRIVAIDGAAVYNMMVKLRTQPEIANKVLDFRPTCYQTGVGYCKDAGFAKGYYDN